MNKKMNKQIIFFLEILSFVLLSFFC